MRTLLAILSLILTGCGADTTAPKPAEARPMRIVSLDYCADQYVLKFADRTQILAVSPDAGKSFSYMRDAASGVPTVRPRTEDVLALQPDLIVRAYGGGAMASARFQRAGIPVLEVGWISDLEGVRANAERMATALGHPDRGEALAGEIDARLDALKAVPRERTALYLTPGGVTTGPGGLVDAMIRRAGLDNYETQTGWRTLPLERLVQSPPDMIIRARFDGGGGGWSAARHPIIRNHLAKARVVDTEGAWTACGAWFILDAIEALSDEPTP